MSHRIVGLNFDTMSRETTFQLGQSTLYRKTAPAVSAGLIITTSTTQHAQATARLKQFRMLGPTFFQAKTEKDDEPDKHVELGRGVLQCQGWQVLEPGAAVLAEQSFAGNHGRAFSKGQRP